MEEGSLAQLFLFGFAQIEIIFGVSSFNGSHLFEVIVKPDPITALSRCSNSLENLDYNLRTALTLCMMIAKRCFLKLWKSDLVSKFQTWLTELVKILHGERL